DATGCSATRIYGNLRICPAITTTPNPLPDSTIGAVYSQSLSASPPETYTFAVTAGALPTGLALTPDGVLSGTTTCEGTFAFTSTAPDSTNCSGDTPYNVRVCPSLITLNPASLPGGRAGAAYSQPLTGSGGVGPYTFAVTNGALPDGLTLSAAGVIS